MIIHRQIVLNKEQPEQLGIFEYLKHSMSWTSMNLSLNFLFWITNKQIHN